MKRVTQFALLVMILSGCDVYVIEPAYDSRDRMIGHYDVEEYSETYREWVSYSIYISKAASRDKIYIDNFYGSEISVYAYVNYGRVTIPFQIVNGYEIEGAGSFHDYYLTLQYSVRDVYNNSYTDFCETEARRY